MCLFSFSLLSVASATRDLLQAAFDADVSARGPRRLTHNATRGSRIKQGRLSASRSRVQHTREGFEQGGQPKRRAATTTMTTITQKRTMTMTVATGWLLVKPALLSVVRPRIVTPVLWRNMVSSKCLQSQQVPFCNQRLDFAFFALSCLTSRDCQ